MLKDNYAFNQIKIVLAVRVMKKYVNSSPRCLDRLIILSWGMIITPVTIHFRSFRKSLNLEKQLFKGSKEVGEILKDT